MAIRQHTVWPDTVITTPNGELAVVSDDAFYAGLMRAAQLMPVGGGSLAVALDRTKTGMPNESVTTMAIIEWRSHTDGKPAVEPERRDPVKVVAAMHGAVEGAEPEALDKDEADVDELDLIDVEDHAPTAAA